MIPNVDNDSLVYLNGDFVRLGDATELVPKVVADKIAERNPDIVVRVKKADTVPAEDDPYADYKIPDDLMW